MCKKQKLPEEAFGAVKNPIMTKASTKQSLLFFDGLRGLAALYVVVGHARWLLWEGGEKFRENADAYSLLHRVGSVAMSFFKYGHEVVLFFFVLSGFVIHLGNAAKLHEQRALNFNYREFFYRRAKRILPPFLFALLLTYACDCVMAANNFSLYANATPNPHLNGVINFDHSVLTLLGNLLFVQSIHTPVFGSNGPLWSLAYEWWFYTLYPLLLFFFAKNKAFTVWVLLLLAVALMAGWKTNFHLFDKVAGYLFSWWLGAVAADVYAGRKHVKGLFYKPLLLILLLVPYLSSKESVSYLLRDTVMALGFFGLVLFLLQNRNAKAVKLLEALKFTGSFSYTLYVTHFPLLVLMNGLLLSYTGNVLPSSFLYTWLGVLIVTGFAWLLHFVVEVPFLSSSVKKPPVKPVRRIPLTESA